MSKTISKNTINLLGSVLSADKFNKIIWETQGEIELQGETSIYVESAKRILEGSLTNPNVIC
jgi:hypothetical protein